jgi:hypothetical protein
MNEPAAVRRSVTLPLALLGVLIVYVLGATWYAKTGAIWSPDCGARLIQVQSILKHPPEWWISYPAVALDPDHQNSPLSFYEYTHHGRTYVFYSFLFALLNAPLFRAFGYFGLALLPMLGGLGAVAATYALGQRLRLRFPVVPALVAGLATPLALYSVVFWDHSILTGLATLAIYLALTGAARDRGRYWLAAGAVLGSGLWLHEILAPYVPALILGAWWLRGRHRWLRHSGLLLLGALAFAVPLLAANAQVYGAPMGPHMGNNRLGSPGAILEFLKTPAEWGPGALYTLIGWGDACPGFTWQLRDWLADPSPKFKSEIQASLWMAVPLAGWLLLGITGWWKRWWSATVVVALGLVANAVWVFQHPDWAHSPFLACPLLLLAFWAPLRSRGQDEATHIRAGLFQALVVINGVYTLMNLLKPTLGGTEWGSRHLLSIYPSLVLLGWAAVEQLLPAPGETTWRPGTRPLVGTAALLLALSLPLLVHGSQSVYGMHRNNRAMADAIRQCPDDVVVTSVWWSSMNGAPAFFDKKILYAGDSDHPAPPLFERMRAHGVKSYTLVGFSEWDLSAFAGPLGYLPVQGTDRRAPLGLAMGRYMLGEVPPPAPAPAPADPNLPPSVDLRGELTTPGLK